MGPVRIDGSRVVAHTFNQVGKGMKVVDDVLETLDFTGGFSALRSGLRGDKAGVALSVGGMLLGPLGAEGSAPARAAVNIVKEAGTHEALEVAGKSIIPTRQVAEKLISLAGGTIQRVEKAHLGAGHAYAHINYLTALN
jgi:hypothetical protein